MKKDDIENDINLLKDCELVRYTLKEDILSLEVVADNEKEEEHHCCHHDCDDDDEEEEEHSCMEGLNGHLFTLIFKGVKDFSEEGEECDNYILKDMSVEGNKISLSYEGRNLVEPDSKLEFSFSYQSYEVIDDGKIASPEV